MALAKQWATKHVLVFALSKFQLTHFTRTCQRFDIERLVIMTQQEIIPSRTSKYLGLTLDLALVWKQHIQAIKFIRALASLAGLT
jgi:hypothetical protein